MSSKVSNAKHEYRERFIHCLKEFKNILLVDADNVGSSHFQRIRADLRGDATILMGKNTVIRKILRLHAEEFPQHQQILSNLFGNLGFVFTNKSVNDVREKILANKVGAPARVGAIAPCDVVLQAGPTGLDPGQTAFLQALNIPTMIVKGQIEIKTNVDLIKEGEKVSPSQAALLVKLGLRPFKYGLGVKYVFEDGVFFQAKLLDISSDDLVQNFQSGIRKIACISLRAGYPTLASIPHSLSNGFKNIFHISIATSFSIKQTEEIKKLLDDPEALAAALAESASKAEEKKEESVEAAPAEEEEEEEDDDMGAGGLFGDDDDW